MMVGGFELMSHLPFLLSSQEWSIVYLNCNWKIESRRKLSLRLRSVGIVLLY